MTNQPTSPPPHVDPSRPVERSDALSEELVVSNLDGAGTTTITFTLPAEIDAEFASVVGDFNEWDPHRGVMARDETGGFSCSVEVVLGQRYQYRFLLDGDRWVNDFSADSYAPNEFGGDDAVIDLSTDADRELAAARARQADGDVPANDRPGDTMAPLINNTGDDGGAATG